MSTYHSWDQSKDIELDFVFIIRFFEFGKQLFSEALSIMYLINWQKICWKSYKIFTHLFSFFLLDSFFKFLFSIFCHFRSFSSGFNHSNFITTFITTWILVIRLIVVVEDQKKFTCCYYYFWVFIQACFTNNIASLFIIPNFSFVKLNHNIQRSPWGAFIWILYHCVNKVLHFPVYVLNFMIEIELLKIGYNNRMKKLSKSLIFTSEKLKKHRQYYNRRNNIFASHNFKRSHKSEPNLGVHDRVILLKKINQFWAQVLSDLFFVYSANMSHKFTVIIKSLISLSGILLEFI